MKTRVLDRRRSVRLPAACPVIICDRRGRPLARGRAANTSETGLFLITNGKDRPPRDGEVILRISVPAASGKGARRGPLRVVCYLGRIIRTQVLGHLVGLGVEFVKKLK